MISVALSGPAKRLTDGEKTVVAQALKRMSQKNPNVDQFVSGGARGVDVWAAECAIRYFRDAKHHVYVPTWKPTRTAPPQPCKHDRKGLRRLARVAAELGVYMKWHWADAGVGTEATGLLRRNDILAVNCTHLLAYPETPRERDRSGTWATVRRARKLHRPVLLVPLDGSGRVRL